jgi:hypothetical protein
MLYVLCLIIIKNEGIAPRRQPKAFTIGPQGGYPLLKKHDNGWEYDRKKSQREH